MTSPQPAASWREVPPSDLWRGLVAGGDDDGGGEAQPPWRRLGGGEGRTWDRQDRHHEWDLAAGIICVPTRPRQDPTPRGAGLPPPLPPLWPATTALATGTPWPPRIRDRRTWSPRTASCGILFTTCVSLSSGLWPRRKLLFGDVYSACANMEHVADGDVCPGMWFVS